MYLYSVLCMFNTCHPCSYDEQGIQYSKFLDHQFEALFGDYDIKSFIMNKEKTADSQTTNEGDDHELTVEQLD